MARLMSESSRELADRLVRMTRKAVICAEARRGDMNKQPETQEVPREQQDIEYLHRIAEGLAHIGNRLADAQVAIESDDDRPQGEQLMFYLGTAEDMILGGRAVLMAAEAHLQRAWDLVRPRDEGE